MIQLKDAHVVSKVNFVLTENFFFIGHVMKIKGFILLIVRLKVRMLLGSLESSQEAFENHSKSYFGVAFCCAASNSNFLWVSVIKK